MTPAEFDHRLALIKKYGTNSFSALLLYDDMAIFPFSRTEGFIGFRNSGTLLTVMGDPVCPEQDYRVAAEEFIAYCRGVRKQFMVICCGEAFKCAVEDLSFSYLRIGEDFIFETASYVPKGDKTKMIRLARNQALRAGAVVKEYNHRQGVDVDLERTLTNVAARWLRKVNRFKAHLMGLNIFDHREIKRYFYAEVQGRPIAFVACLPIYGRNGLLFEDVIRDPDAPYGIIELITLHVVDLLREEGGKMATFGVSPKLDISTLPGSSRLVAILGVWIAKQLFNLNTLYHFRKKFYTSIAEPSYLLKYPKGLGLWDLARILTSF